MSTPELIKCPNCGTLEFEIHTIVNLTLEAGIIDNGAITWRNPREVRTCIACGYTINSAEDLEMVTLNVYIIGDSISHRRHGLVNLSKKVGDRKWLDSEMDLLANPGYFKFQLPKIPESGHAWVWVFTKSAWKRAQSDDSFRLIDKQYSVNVEEMI